MITFNFHRLAAALLAAGSVMALAGAGAGTAAAEEPAPARMINPNVDIPEFGSITSETDGKKLYESICQGCHMPDAKGAQGAGMYPALAANPKLASAAYPVYVVLNGLRGMPKFGAWLNDGQIAAVVNFVITHFGNAAAMPATAEEVKAARANGQPAGSR
jgi:mono/diheme cytochrome c family protein